MSLLTAESNTRAQRLFASSGYLHLATFDAVYAGGARGLAMWKAL